MSTAIAYCPVCDKEYTQDLRPGQTLTFEAHSEMHKGFTKTTLGKDVAAARLGIYQAIAHHNSKAEEGSRLKEPPWRG